MFAVDPGFVKDLVHPCAPDPSQSPKSSHKTFRIYRKFLNILLSDPFRGMSCSLILRYGQPRGEVVSQALGAFSSAIFRKPVAVPGDGLVMVSRISLVDTGSKLSVVG